MQPKQKNWVFLACMLIVAIFSVVVVFAKVKHQGRYAGQNMTATNVQDVMAEIEVVNKAIEEALRGGVVNRPEVYAKASKLAALLEELVKESPDDPTPARVGEWDRRTTRAVQAANFLADIAGDPATDFSKSGAANRAIQQSCVDCHQQFRKE